MHRDMSRLIAELVLSDEDTANTDSTESSETVVEAVKAEEPAVSDERLEKAESEISELRAVIEELKNKTPSGGVPDVLVRKSDEEDLNDVLKSMSTAERLRFALAVHTNGK
jgi:hypothetical protein